MRDHVRRVASYTDGEYVFLRIHCDGSTPQSVIRAYHLIYWCAIFTCMGPRRLIYCVGNPRAHIIGQSVFHHHATHYNPRGRRRIRVQQGKGQRRRRIKFISH